MYLGDNLLRDGLRGLVSTFRERRARRADPAHPGRRPAVLRRRRARRRADRAPDREAERPALEPRPGRRLPLRPADLRRRPRARALLARRARDHRGDPGPDRRRPARSARRSSAAGGRTPASSPTCSRPTGSCWRRSRPRLEGEVDEDSRVEGRVVLERRRQADALGRPRPGRDRRRRPHRGRLHRPLHLDRRRASTSAAPRSSTRSSSPARWSRTSAPGWRRACSAATSS